MPTPSTDRQVVVRVLAEVELLVDGATQSLSQLERGLLARAALSASVSAESLTPWLWGERPPASAHNRVQALVSGLRRKLAPLGVSLIDTHGSSYRLDPSVTTDFALWTALVDDARAHRRNDPAASLPSYQAALASFRHAPLVGLASTDAVEAEREHFEQLRLTVVEERNAVALALGEVQSLPVELAPLVAAHPYRETLVSQLMLALAATGQQEQALRVYRDVYTRLDDELGVPPSAQLQEAHRQVLAGEAPSAGPVLVRDAQPEARPDALTAPPGPEPVAAGSSLGAPPAAMPVPRTLPRRPATFLGRERELGVLMQAGRDAEHEAVVVSVTGLTGVGKSALAVLAGQRLRDAFPGGTLYLDAATDRGQSTPDTVLGAFLRLMGVSPDAVPDHPDARAGLFRSLIDDRRVLIVLDNVLNDPGASSAHIGDLLPASPGSMAIVTSRLPLADLGDCRRISLRSLDQPDATALLESLVGRDRVVEDPEATTSLVELTGSLPLALRLVGARLAQRPDLAIRSMVDRLREVNGGVVDLDPAGALQSSLEAVWSRIPKDARDAAALLAHLPTHNFSSWVPGSLLGDPARGERAMDGLIEASFVEPVLRDRRQAQYRLHDLVRRATGTHRPVGAGERSAGLARLGETLLALAAEQQGHIPLQFLPPPPSPEAPSPQVTDAQGTPSAAQRTRATTFFETESEMIRALARAVAPTRPGLAWRLLAVSANAHHYSVDQSDWMAAAKEVAAHLDGPGDDLQLGAAVLTLCEAWHLQDSTSQSRTALALADQARRSLTLLGASRYAAAASLVVASAAISMGLRAQSEEALARASDLLVRSPDAVLAGWVGIIQGTIHNDYDEMVDAEREFTRVRDVLATTPSLLAYALATLELSRACWRQGQLGSANILINEALKLCEDIGDEHMYSYGLDARAEVSIELGNGEMALDEATRSFQRAVAAKDAFLTARVRRTRAGALVVLGRLEEAEAELRASVEECTALNRPLSVAAALHELSVVLDLRGNPAAASEALRQERAARASAHLAARENFEAAFGRGRTVARGSRPV
ncbi:AfsR/SARP family transcriptional regulator [Pedococcus soli]